MLDVPHGVLAYSDPSVKPLRGCVARLQPLPTTDLLTLSKLACVMLAACPLAILYLSFACSIIFYRCELDAWFNAVVVRAPFV